MMYVSFSQFGWGSVPFSNFERSRVRYNSIFLLTELGINSNYGNGQLGSFFFF